MMNECNNCKGLYIICTNFLQHSLRFRDDPLNIVAVQKIIFMASKQPIKLDLPHDNITNLQEAPAMDSFKV